MYHVTAMFCVGYVVRGLNRMREKSEAYPQRECIGEMV